MSDSSLDTSAYLGISREEVRRLLEEAGYVARFQAEFQYDEWLAEPPNSGSYNRIFVTPKESATMSELTEFLTEALEALDKKMASDENTGRGDIKYEQYVSPEKGVTPGIKAPGFQVLTLEGQLFQFQFRDCSIPETHSGPLYDALSVVILPSSEVASKVLDRERLQDANCIVYNSKIDNQP